jgi:predicted small lipoprotein YifL
VVAGLSLSACGKKGPPLAPVVHVPAAVDKLTAQRVGNDVYLTITIPSQNIDASTPADVSRIDIFAVTADTPPPRPRIFEIAAKVASVDVRPAPRPGQDAPAAAAAAPQLPAQGASVTIRDALTAADLEPKTLPAAPPRGSTPSAAVPAPVPLPFPHRYYIAIAVSDRGRTGPPGTLLDLPMPPLPDPPRGLTASYDEDAVSLSWEPAGGIIGFLFEAPAALEPAPVDLPPEATPRAPTTIAPASGPTMYNVYREPGAAAASAPPPTAPAVGATPPAPLNAAPIAGLSYRDAAPVVFGTERCYVVRAVRGAPPNGLVSVASDPLCLTPEDTFPPAAPTGLSAIAAEGVISLLWEPNGEADLAGYVILRGRPGDATLQPLTTTPVKDVRYEDNDVEPGARYVYAVQAVDTHVPGPNVSAESNRVEETARQP